MNEFIKLPFTEVFKISKIITILYLEFSKDFYYEGEKHDFWELVYIDKGEMICTAGDKDFTLKGGELIFHKPNEYHNLKSDNKLAPNISVISFETKSKFMKYFENKIIKLSVDDKNLLSNLMNEGLATYTKFNDRPPILGLKKLSSAPFGSEQMTKNMLEMFLIKLYRNDNTLNKNMRLNNNYYDKNLSFDLQQILLFLENNIYQKITINDIARNLNMSESKIKKMFNGYKENGIIKFFNELKIKEAKKLIREKEMNFTMISEKLNFDNIYYFSNCFKKTTGMSPTEYKNSIF